VAMQELAEGPLARANLTIDQVYDETTYIDRSIEMLSRNLGSNNLCFYFIGCGRTPACPDCYLRLLDFGN